MPIVTVEDLQRTAKNVSDTAIILAAKITTVQATLDRSTEMQIGPAPLLASRRNEWDLASSQIRRSILRESDGARWDMLRAMTESEQAVLAVEKQFASPSMILARAGLGTPERSRYLEQIANAGPLEIKNFSEFASQTGNAILGAAITSRLDSMKKNERDLTGVSRAKLAESLVGDQFRSAQRAIKTIKATVRESLARNRSFESGKPMSARDAIGIALQRAEAS